MIPGLFAGKQRLQHILSERGQMPAIDQKLNRRNFLQGTVSAVASSFVTREAVGQQPATPEAIAHGSVARPLTEKEKVARIASNSYPIRFLFKHRGQHPCQRNHRGGNAEEVWQYHHARLSCIYPRASFPA